MPLPKFPINFDALRKALIDEVQKVTQTTCILAQPETQNTPRPKKPYFTMQMVTPAAKEGDDSNDLTVTGTNWNIGGQRKMTVDFNCYGNTHEEAYTYMALWQSSLELQAIQSDLYAAGIAIWLNGNVVDLSALLNTGFEGRAQMQVDFGITSNLTQDLSSIDEATASGTITTDQNNIVDVEVAATVP